MSNCYRCGRFIPNDSAHVRRRVKTGEHQLRRIVGGSGTHVQTHFGMRVVCRFCARSIDQDLHRAWIIEHVQVVGAILVLLAALLLSR